MTGFANVPTHVPGDTFPSADWNVVAANMNGGGLMRMLADSTVTGSVAASINFTSIPATFAHLRLVVYARSDTATTTFDNLLTRINGDSAANYDLQLVKGAAAAASASETFAQSSIQGGLCNGGASPANLFAVTVLDILHYTNAANNKAIDMAASGKSGTTTGLLFSWKGSAFWRSNAAINQLTVLSATGNLAIGSRATLYGMPQ